MRIKVRQAGCLKCLAENFADRRCFPPLFAFQAHHPESVFFTNSNLSCREQGGVVAPKFDLPQEVDPIFDDLKDFCTYREKVRREGFAEFGFHFAGVLVDASGHQINVLQLHGCDGAVPCSGQEHQSYQRTISLFDI